MISRKMYETLHGHSLISDGHFSYEEILNLCPQYNIGVYAFTDHDSLPTSKQLKILHNYSGPTNWILGIEMSSNLPREIEGTTSGLHIVGLFVDPHNSQLKLHCKLTQEARIERMRRIVKHLRKLGLTITERDCLAASGGEVVGRPHIAKAIFSKDKNKKVIEKMIDKLKNDSVTDERAKKRYNTLIQQGDSQIPYVLFLGDDPHFSGIDTSYSYSVDLDKTVSLIRKAGGKAILAHWFTIEKYLPFHKLEELILENRLDGLEVVYGLFAKNTDMEKDMMEQKIQLNELVNKHHCIKSGGADIHSLEDFMMFQENEWYSKETIGLAQSMIKTHKVDTTWSSYKK